MSDLVIVQWNMGVYKAKKAAKKPKKRVFAIRAAKDEARLTVVLNKLLAEYQPTLIALQEAPESHVRPLLQKHGYTVLVGSENIITSWKNTDWNAVVSTPISYYRALGIELELLTPTHNSYKVLVCNVHLSSRLHGGEDNPTHDLERLADELKAYRTANTNAEEIILGDFNLEPFASAFQKQTVLHSNRSLAYVTEQEAKRVPNDKYRTLYNPSWRLYGAEEAPHGSHYFSGAKKGGPWYILDQAFFSSSLVSRPAKVKLVTEVICASTKTVTNLLSRKVSQPDKKIGSDHLPIVWTVTPKP